jgi:hypothetical protein
MRFGKSCRLKEIIFPVLNLVNITQIKQIILCKISLLVLPEIDKGQIMTAVFDNKEGLIQANG